jgi:CRISPR/Cas system-associated exonuclease Cas4 (RecB family)
MFVFESKNTIDDKTDIITAKTLVEICENVLEYHNGAYKKDTNNDIVRFMNFTGELILETTEVNLKFILYGADDEVKQEVTKEMTEDSNTFWNMKHSEIEVVTFKNPSHNGEAVWDSEYLEDEHSDDEEDIEESNDNEVI